MYKPPKTHKEKVARIRAFQLKIQKEILPPLLEAQAKILEAECAVRKLSDDQFLLGGTNELVVDCQQCLNQIHSIAIASHIDLFLKLLNAWRQFENYENHKAEMPRSSDES